MKERIMSFIDIDYVVSKYYKNLKLRKNYLGKLILMLRANLKKNRRHS